MIRVQMIKRILALGGISIGLMLCPAAAQQSQPNCGEKLDAAQNPMGRA